MTDREKLLNKAKKMIQETYDLAVKNDWVQKPVSYALYRAWKYCDEHEKPREVKTDE